MGFISTIVVFATGICVMVWAKWVVKAWIILWPQHPTGHTRSRENVLRDIEQRASNHKVASSLWDLISQDGAGSWPPNADHKHNTWPKPLRPYRDIYMELAPLLPQAEPSLDAQVNINRIETFRQRHRSLLRERIDITEVMHLLEATKAGRWELLPRDVFNAFYCCIASNRHAYRWGTIPVVLAAQLEECIDLPMELIKPWELMQQHFGCPSESGNVTSNILLNFDVNGTHIHKINTGLGDNILAAEEAFARIFYDAETLSLPIYRDLILSVVAFTQDDRPACARHVASVNYQLRFALGAYFDNLHNEIIPHSAWLSRIQGFYAWGTGSRVEAKTDWETFDGLSGNQVLIFQALDAWLGLEQYLSLRDMENNVPRLQREFCCALREYSFRELLGHECKDEYGTEILRDMGKIVKKLRMFRNVHRVRAKTYLSEFAPERTYMTAGKGVLQPTLEDSLEQLDVFMVRRLKQTI